MSSRWILVGAALAVAVILSLRLFDGDGADSVEPTAVEKPPGAPRDADARVLPLEAAAAPARVAREELAADEPEPAARIHGRLVNDATGAPLAGVSLLVKRGARNVHSCIVDFLVACCYRRR